MPKNDETPKAVNNDGLHRAMPIILLALAVFIGICFITKDNTGMLGYAISGVLCGLFSVGAYAIPALLALHALFYQSDVKNNRIATRIIFSSLAIIAISSLAHAINYIGVDMAELPFDPVRFYYDGAASLGGGFLGGMIAFALMKMLGQVGVIILSIAIFLIYIAYFFSKGSALREVFRMIIYGVLTFFAIIERGVKKVLSFFKKSGDKKKKKKDMESNEVLAEDDFFDVDNGMERLEVSGLGIIESRSQEAIESNPTLHDKVRHTHDSRVLYDDYGIDEEATANDGANAEEIDGDAFEIVDGDIIIDDEAGEHAAASAPKEESASPFSESAATSIDSILSDSADSIFTSDFDPYSLSAAEKLAGKPSSRTVTEAAVQRDSRPSVTESIDDITPEQVERIRREEEFERRKRAMLEEQRAREAQMRAAAENARKNVEFHVQDSDEIVSVARVEEESVSVKIEKFDQVETRPEITPEAYEASIYATVYPTAPERQAPRTAEPVKPEFKPYSVPRDEEKTPGLVFEFDQGDEPETLTVERTMLTADNTASGFEAVEEVSVDQVPSDIDITHVQETSEIAPVTDNAPVSSENAEVRSDAIREQASVTQAPVGQEVSQSFLNDNAPSEQISAEGNRYSELSSAGADRSFEIAEDEPSEQIFEINPEDDEEEDEISPVLEQPEEDIYVEREEIPPEEQNPFISEARSMFNMFRHEDAIPEPKNDEAREDVETDDSVDEYSDENTEDSDSFIQDSEDDIDEEEDDEPPFDFIGSDGEMRKIENVREEPKNEPPKKKAPDYSNYKLPPIDILGLDPARGEDEIGNEIRENTRILIETLESFNVTASIKGVDRGPRVTRYEVVPARGVKVNQVTNLFDDIRLALAAEGVRMEAPIPGKSAIGFEIPNKHPKNVRLRELIECDEFMSSGSKTFVCLGKDVAGNPIFGDIAKFPHALVAGATGMGKSVCINSILMSILYKARPDEVKFILIDPKKVEFKIYGGIPHLLVPVVTEAKQAAGALMWAVEEMERRYDLIEKYNVRNIQAYNERVALDPSMGAPMSKIIIVIDELNDLMMQVRDPVEDLIMRIAQKARAAGIHLIIGTQRPDVKVITGTIKANINTRISCKVTSVVDSRTILEMAGAEKLLNKGDMLFKPTDRTEPVRVQGCFVSDDEVEAVIDFVKQFSSSDQYDEEVLAEINKAAQKCGKDKKGGGASADIDDGGDDAIGYYNDQQFLDAVELAIRSGKVSTSLLQRKLQIGYGKAARLIDAMEEIGVVSEPNGQKPRDVLVTMDEWREKLSRVEI
ncbi:MAG: DNA translocase FtsK 4TM domain-containing protein [Clostridia bacterium]|nr:DNA translocase FtsK 4TM domain-containing protein [Clostridia bacterium]